MWETEREIPGHSFLSLWDSLCDAASHWGPCKESECTYCQCPGTSITMATMYTAIYPLRWEYDSKDSLVFCAQAHIYSCNLTFFYICLSWRAALVQIVYVFIFDECVAQHWFDSFICFNASPASVSLWMRALTFAKHVQCFNYSCNLPHALEGEVDYECMERWEGL